MKYSLVLQLPANDITDYDKLIEIEDALEKYLYGLANVDGHDCGSGEMNIFIFTDKPEETFEKAKFIIKAAGLLIELSAAYRLTTGEEYSRLWPVGSTEPFIVL
jgi:hypothetical protein